MEKLLEPKLEENSVEELLEHKKIFLLDYTEIVSKKC